MPRGLLTLRLLVPAALVAFFRRAPVDVIDPPAPVDDLRELRRLRGLTEIHRLTAENIVFYDFARRLQTKDRSR